MFFSTSMTNPESSRLGSEATASAHRWADENARLPCVGVPADAGHRAGEMPTVTAAAISGRRWTTHGPVEADGAVR